MALFVLGKAPGLVGTAFTSAMQISTMISDMKLGDDIRNDIFEKIEDIKALLDKLKANRDEDFKESMKAALTQANDRLSICERECQEIADQLRLKQLCFSSTQKDTLKRLQQKLSDIHSNLESEFLFVQLNDNNHQIKEGRIQAKRDIAYPQAGIYPLKDGVLKPAAKPGKPEVEKVGSQIVVRWKDDENSSGSVKKYEMRLDESYDRMIPIEDGSCRCLSIGPPQIEPGNVYTIQIRAINGGGPGEWSDPTTAHYMTAPPNKPDKPRVTPGYDDVELSIRVPGIKESNGSPVDRIFVKYISDTDTKWSIDRFSFPPSHSQSTYNALISKLSPDTHYVFRIFLVNEFGKSVSSEPVNVTTKLPTPGRPTNVRQSSHCGSNFIKIRWKLPKELSQFVDQYEIKYKKKSHESDPKCIFEIINTSKLYAIAKKLSSDTQYVFHVSAVNRKGEIGEAVRVAAETRWKKITRFALSPLVLVGGAISPRVVSGIEGALYPESALTVRYDDTNTGCFTETATNVAVRFVLKDYLVTSDNDDD